MNKIKVNKKLIFSYLLLGILFLPLYIYASTACDLIKNIKTAFYTVGGTVVVISWVVAGIMYLTSFGSQEKMGTAKKAITAAIIGTVIVLISTLAIDVTNSLLGNIGAIGNCP